MHFKSTIKFIKGEQLPSREDVHGWSELPFLHLSRWCEIHIALVTGICGSGATVNEAFWSDVASSPTGSVEEVGEIRRVVLTTHKQQIW